MITSSDSTTFSFHSEDGTVLATVGSFHDAREIVRALNIWMANHDPAVKDIPRGRTIGRVFTPQTKSNHFDPSAPANGDHGIVRNTIIGK